MLLKPYILNSEALKKGQEIHKITSVLHFALFPTPSSHLPSSTADDSISCVLGLYLDSLTILLSLKGRDHVMRFFWTHHNAYLAQLYTHCSAHNTDFFEGFSYKNK